MVLANREEYSAIPEIRKLVEDERWMVRACAIGALTFMKDEPSKEIILKSVNDSNLEVQKSAIHAAIKLGFKITEKQIENINKDDSEIVELVSHVKKQWTEGI